MSGDDVYAFARSYNTVVGTIVILLCARSLLRSWSRLNPSERLVLFALAGYAACAGLGSYIALQLRAPHNEGTIMMMGAQTWAAVALITSKPRGRHASEVLTSRRAPGRIARMTTPTPAPLDPPVPTQVQQPWRATARTTFQFIVALATLFPFIAGGIYQDLDQAPAVVAQVLAVAAAITRIMALPQVESFLRNFLPFLAAQPTERIDGRRRVERGEVSTRTLAVVSLIAGVVALLISLFGARAGS